MMSRTFSSLRVASLLLLAAAIGPAASAGEQGWKLIESEGPVEVSVSGGGFTPIALSNKVEPGSILRTGPGGRAVIENNGDKITVAPNSEIDLPQQTGAMTEMKQPAGTALYDMVPRGVDRFKVETPFLAAVIKGTVFTVNVTKEGGAVQVLRGIVQVANGNGQFASLVYPGQTATVPAQRNGEVRIMGRPPAGTPPAAQPKRTEATPPAPAATQAASATDPAHPQITQAIGPHVASIDKLTNGLITSIATSPQTGKDSANPRANQVASLPDDAPAGGLLSTVTTVADGVLGSGSDSTSNGPGAKVATGGSPPATPPVTGIAPVPAVAPIGVPVVVPVVTPIVSPIAPLITAPGILAKATGVPANVLAHMLNGNNGNGNKNK